MANITMKTSTNVFYKARCEAAKHNEQLSSREGAADIMSIDRGRLYRIESGISNPYPEEIHLMSDLYNAPELQNYYCRNVCPLGRDMPRADIESLDRISIRAFAIFREIMKTNDVLLDITEDGIVDDSEKADMEKVLQNLEKVEEVAQSLKLWVKKNL